MEIVNIITEVISSLGFPIACTCALFYLLIKEKEKNSIFLNYIQKNTQVLEDLKEIIEEVINKNG